ncbi:GATOR complex protein DEPDC5, partial [Geodia barretti]
MWDFDPNGEFFFDKAVGGFLRELFVRWREAGCNHDVTIIFFWRLHFDPSLSRDSVSISSSVREDKKRGLLYEDFFRVIVESTSNSDWSSELINIKKSFLKLKPLIDSLRGKANAELCKSEEGNILEAINLALNIMERQNLDTNLQLSGQQIVVLTAGTGYFEIDRELMQITNERLVCGGVTADLVSMRDQPLHAMPMFKFHSKDEEFFSVPHWINYSFYSSTRGRVQRRFQPRIYLSDHLVNNYLQKDPAKPANGRLYRPNTGALSTATDPQLRTWIDTDRYDGAVFKLPNARARTKVYSVARMAEGGGRVGGEVSKLAEREVGEESGGSPSGGGPIVTFRLGDTDPFDGPHDSISPSPESYPTEVDASPRQAQFTRSLAPPRQRYKSENYGDGTADKPGSSLTRRDRSIFTSVGSAEGLRQGSTPWDTYHDTPGNDCPAQQKKILSFSNPFDPNKIHSEAPAFQRRWVHVFPTNKRGVAFQTHHETEGEPRNSDPTDPSWTMIKVQSASSSPQTPGQRRGILKQSGSSPGERGGSIGGSRSGSFRGSEKGPTGALERARGSPASLSPRERHREGGMKRNRSLLSTNGTSVANRGSPGSEPGSRALTPSSSRHTSATNTPDLLRRQRWAEPSLLSNTTSENNFSSIRRTGVDWISLVKPAHLPVTTDFYPAK